LYLFCLYREELRTTPEKVETMIENKHVLAASKLLVSSIKTISSKEMTQIGALDDIKRTLLSQKNVIKLKDIPFVIQLIFLFSYTNRHYMI
jgi:hypothetical protein